MNERMTNSRLILRNKEWFHLRIPWHKRIYALYKGDQFITEGTIREISRTTNKSIEFLRYMTYPIYEKRSKNGPQRLQIVPLDDEQFEDYMKEESQ